jgi:acyl dehydratase
VEGPFTRIINYGLNRVRFPVPVMAGASIRAHSVLQAIEETAAAWRLTWQISIEVQGQTKPALVADWLVRYDRD